MNPRKWTKATQTYNDLLEEENKTLGLPTSRKNPRALINKLGEVESEILGRLVKGDYKCKCLIIFSSPSS